MPLGDPSRGEKSMEILYISKSTNTSNTPLQVKVHQETFYVSKSTKVLGARCS